MSLDTSSNYTLLDPPNHPGSPAIRLEYHGYYLDLGAASDKLIDCFVAELTGRLVEMVERNNRHGWKAGPLAFEYDKSQVRYHLKGLMAEQSRRRDVALRTMPVLVEV
jgi:hypothetical protein